MLKLIQLAQAAIEADDKCILCSVMRLEGSGYGRVGARLLLTESGEREGYVSGGCLERDLRHRAWAEAAETPKLIAFDTRGNSITPSRYNTGCQGVVYVLCQPFGLQSFFIDVAARLLKQRQSARLLTVYHSQSHVVRTGDSMAIFADGSTEVSCSRLDEAKYLRRLLVDAKEPFTATIRDRQGARVEVTVEFLEPPPRLIVFGSGDDVVPVVRLALEVGWEVGVVGHRKESMTSDRFCGAQLYSSEAAAVPPAWSTDQFTHVLLMTHDMVRDAAILPEVLTATVGSVGMLGSKHRMARLATELHRRGVDVQLLERVRCPVGLSIGAISPQEIALSIMAELVALARGGSGSSLTQRAGAIHERLPHYDWECGQLEFVEGTANSLGQHAGPLDTSTSFQSLT